MRIIKQGLINPQSIRKSRWDIVKALGKLRKRGSVLDVLELEGSYALENAELLYNSLNIGDKLSVCESVESPNKDMLAVRSGSGMTVGFLPVGVSLLPRLMLSKGCVIRCYVEYIDFTNSLLTVCVSLYSEEY